MPSTYTTNLGIEKIATGEQSGTWGTTTNTNLDLVDEAVNGIVTVTLAGAGSSGSPNTLAITNGASSDGRNKYIEFNDGGDLGGTAYVQLTPNDAEKIVHIRNSLSASRSILIFQGTYNASNDFEIPNGADVVLKFDGAGAGAVVSDVFTDLNVTKLTAGSLASSGNITFGDDDRAIFGAGSDLQIWHDGTDSIVMDNGTGDLQLRSNGTGVYIRKTNGESIADFQTDNACKLYYDNGEKLATTTNGIDVTGTIIFDGGTTSADLNFGDSDKAVFGAGNDLEIYHDGSNSYLSNTGTGILIIGDSNGDVRIRGKTGEESIVANDDGSVDLYYDNNKKFETTTNGVDITGRAEGTVTTDNDGGFDLNASNYFICTPSASLDISFTNETTGVAGAILLVNTTPQTITVDADVFLSAADLTAINEAGTYLLGFYCPDGTNVYMSATPALTEGS